MTVPAQLSVAVPLTSGIVIRQVLVALLIVTFWLGAGVKTGGIRSRTVTVANPVALLPFASLTVKVTGTPPVFIV